MTTGVGGGKDSTLNKFTQSHKTENHTSQSLPQGQSPIYNAEIKTEIKTQNFSRNEFALTQPKGTYHSIFETNADDMTNSNDTSPAGKHIQNFLDKYPTIENKDDIDFETLGDLKKAIDQHEAWIADKGVLSWVGHKISRLASMILPAYFSKTQQAADIYAELMPKQQEIYFKKFQKPNLIAKIIEKSKLPGNAKKSFNVNNLTVDEGSYSGSIMNGLPEGMGELVTKEYKYIGNFKEGRFVEGLKLPRTEESSDSKDTDTIANIVNEEISADNENEKASNKQIIEESKLPFNAKRSFEVNNLTVNDGSYTGSIMNGKPEGMGKLITKEFEYIGNFKEGKFVDGLKLPRTEESSDSVGTDTSANIVNEEIFGLASEFQNEEPITLQNEKEALPVRNVSKSSGEAKKAPVDVRNKYIEKLGGYYTGPTINGQCNGRGSIIFDSNPHLQYIGKFEDGDPVEGFVKYEQNPVTKEWEGDFNKKISWKEVLSDKTENAQIIEVQNKLMETGASYTGPTRNGDPHGKGYIIYEKRNRKYEGVYDNGRPTGDFVEYRKKGTNPDIWEETGKTYKY